MKKISLNISLFLLTILVVFLSMGFNVSKMRCDIEGSLYLGTEVPSCSQDNEVSCVENQEKVSCCMIEIEQSCCPETNDKSCASSTQNIHFDFETLLTSFESNFKDLSLFSYVFILYDKGYAFKNHIDYISDVPPPKIHKPELVEIQSFLL